ncbi:MAG: HD-GYP domain-containing protein [Rubrivivax sp.]|nr:HD-GYP domain-containing protein [Rubrivivax sp.]
MDRLLLGRAEDAVAPTGAALDLRLSELVGALSHALDLTEGQPKGHCTRACWIGMQIGREIGLADAELWQLYYTLLLKDLGCSSNAARICELYLTDDLQFKREFKRVGDGLPQMLRFIVSHTGLSSSVPRRVLAVLNILRNGPQIAQELIATRCQRGADIARQLRFPEPVSRGIHSLDEHWNGGGKPEWLAGEAIPLFSRIALLAQVVDVFQVAAGPQAALAEARSRAGRWFDPALVRALVSAARRPGFWAALASPTLERAVLELEPGQHRVMLDDDYLDDIATAFGQVVDAKSPFTSGHSARVADYTEHIALRLGLSADRRRWLKRGALLHDVGKLGVSNAVLDKPGALDGDEWNAVRSHALHTEAILSRIGAFGELARVASAHHERLDGRGYPHGLAGDAISIETRIITTADIFDAISATRPYRDAVPVPQTLAIMAGSVGSAIDPLCFEALTQVLGVAPEGLAG